ncbi:MAG: glycosyltransferase family 2 protein [Chitinophagales bacterium]|nr:glycosyltransferase family 2 protein [Chitinophagales bacterium]
MSGNPKIFSFVIISFNRPQETIEVVQNILEIENVDGFSKEILVINNGSEKSYGSFEAYLDNLNHEDRQKVIYIDHPENTGVAGGRNIGIKKATGNYLFFIDDDAEFEENFVLPFTLEKFKEYEKDNVKLIGFVVKNYYDGSLDLPVKDKSKAREKEFLNNLFWGGAHVIKKEVFDDVGLYTDEFFYGMEEYDLAYKTLDAGYRILFTSSINVLHKVSPEGREPERTKFRRMLENKVLVAYKYLPKRYVLSHLFMWSFFYLYKSKGHITGFIKIFTSLKERSKNTERNVISKETIKYIRSVKGRLWY